MSLIHEWSHNWDGQGEPPTAETYYAAELPPGAYQVESDMAAAIRYRSSYHPALVVPEAYCSAENRWQTRDRVIREAEEIYSELVPACKNPSFSVAHTALVRIVVSSKSKGKIRLLSLD